MEHKTIYKLYQYAFCGDDDFFMGLLKELAIMSEEEIWFSSDKEYLDILKFYILNVFDKAFEDNLIIEENECSIFNTGLLTQNQEEIYGFFILNYKNEAQKWYFKGFFCESERVILHNFKNKPQLITFINNKQDYYFDTDKQVFLNIDHILDDNWDRFDNIIKKQGKFIVQSLIYNAFNQTLRKLRRNNRIAIPQYYNRSIMYLLPIEFYLYEKTKIVMALAVEKLPTGHYRGNTILTSQMCYARARLVMKLDDCWLNLK